jgi:hypothetical protein
MPGVAYDCNPSYSGGGDQKDCDLRPAWAKNKQDPMSTDKLGMAVHLCNPS